ncbi:myotubularin-related protein 6 isoform X2 [Rhincodon typus]|uniref:myotubularin-related protein 6 isoform X2 n=1 Tax=Rhincodon typus TaxID=259920 RepID=UPI002030AAF6|nr:myotubularin-related protein 6 isoform X2 [Rhincodon typus]
MEHIRTPKVEQVKCLDRFSSKKSTTGTLHLTTTHLIYRETTTDSPKEIWIMHHHIAVVEKLPLTAVGCPLVIHCKNFRVIHFIIPRERDCHDIFNSLLKLSRPVKYDDLYAFSYTPKKTEYERMMGWKVVNLNDEYQRMRIPNDIWQLTDVNRGYKVCDTYPTELYVPRSVSKPIIVGSSKFRSKGRFPALSYFFHQTQAAICRCSQPLSGFSARCLEDEHMLQAISKANPNSHFMYVMDTRPKLNAIANRAAGKGYENEDNYSNIRFKFVGIENIHVMRASLQKVNEVCGTKELSLNDFLIGLESSGWLRHIKAVLDAATSLAKAVGREGASVLVHCSDGWDRTAQVCSLGSLLLDPYYRTIKGFMVLIEKDWITFGHKFAERCGQLDGDPKEISPVFTQFIECVWHLTEQFPRVFEYSETYLLEIHEHVHSCQFGNFIGNCQKEREAMKFWRCMYHQFDITIHPRQSQLSRILTFIEQNNQLEMEAKKLEEQIIKLGQKPCAVYSREPFHPVSQLSRMLKASETVCKEEQQTTVESNSIRTLEDGNISGDECKELKATFSKTEPTLVNLELGMAKMTC